MIFDEKKQKTCYSSLLFIFLIKMTHNDPKALIIEALQQAHQKAIDVNALPPSQIDVQLTRPKAREHGDFATNMALMLAKGAQKSGREVADILLTYFACDVVESYQIAGAGFINFFLKSDDKYANLYQIIAQGERYGHSAMGQGVRVLVEYVSANPTSALHVGHGRGAAIGKSLVNILHSQGYDTDGEYYINDAGRQMDILATSTYLRYLELVGEPVVFAKNGYVGDYVKDIAQGVLNVHGDKFACAWGKIIDGAPLDEQDDDNGNKIGDKEAHIDVLIENTKAHLGDDYALFHAAALDSILADIKDDLAQFGVHFNNWFSEQSLVNRVEEVIARLDKAGHLYEKDGNLWFRSSAFGDEKDRVLRRKNGLLTYFATDIAYHEDKFLRGYNRLIDIWGADHHGYVARVKAAMMALGHDADAFSVIFVQFVALWRDGQKVQMSSRSGSFVSLRELREEVGNDAARFYYVARRPEVHIDFDLDLAKQESRDNAVYYIHYAHARATSVLNKAKSLGIEPSQGMLDDKDDALVAQLLDYPKVLQKSAQALEVHIVTNYLKDLAAAFHSWYNDVRILPKDGNADDMACARLYLAQCARIVLANGLALLDINAKDSM